MRFTLDSRPASAHRAERWLLWGTPVAVAVFLLLERLLAPVLGSVWSVLIAIVVVGSPIGALLRMVTAGRPPRAAAMEGLALGTGTALVYAWVFAAPWI